MIVLLPIAGRDVHFPEADFPFPKPLIEIAGSPMIEHVIRPYLAIPDARFVFVVQDEDCRRFSLEGVLRVIAGGAEIVRLKAPTQGAVCSCLMAFPHLDTDEELVVANSDHVFSLPLPETLDWFRGRGLDAGVMSFDSTHPRFSYLRSGPDGMVEEIVEKRVISRRAVAGLYWFRSARDFVSAAQDVLRNGGREFGGYYISQVLNELILGGRTVGNLPISPDDVATLYSPRKVDEYDGALLGLHGSAPGAARPVLLLPMAGEGRRFAEAGYANPKPFIDVVGKPMIQRVLENLGHRRFRTVLVARSSHLADPSWRDVLDRLGVSSVVETSSLTEGPACTVLLARSEISMDAPLLIANCDQVVDFDCAEFVADCMRRRLDGSILTFREPGRHPKWSYVRTDAHGLVREVKEKVAISDQATVGIYLFTRGRDFVDAAVDMIARSDRTNGEFYVCPVYNYLIRAGARIGTYEVAVDAMHGLGVPDDLKRYEELLAAGGGDAEA